MTRKPDQFEIRARELCTASGADPDARVPRPDGAKSWPAWCGFRQTAMNEASAIKAAAVVATIPEQSAEYQNAPLRIFGDHEESTVAQMRTCLAVGNTVGGVICADGHLGYAQPVGGVIAYEGQISISGVGFDIGCGNMAVRLGVPFYAVKDRAGDLLRQIRQEVSFGVGRVNETRAEHALFDDKEAWRASGMEDYHAKARAQLGTVGSGNHYVDLMVETTHLDDPEFSGNVEGCPVWVGVHFGSRGLGHTTATRYLKLAGGKDGMHVAPIVIAEASDLGERYIAAMELAGRYAYAGREWVVERVCNIIGGAASRSVTKTVHNHHNYAWREEHNGRKLWVVRKGATPAFPGQEGFVGGSMGDDAVIVEGLESPASRAAFYSTVHGAGRLFGRMQAKRTFSRAQMDEWLQRRGVVLAGGDLDESPMAYRRLPDVLAHHVETVRVLHTLRPFAVAMAGDGEFDPWKD